MSDEPAAESSQAAGELEQIAQGIARDGRREVIDRLRTALRRQADTAGVTLADDDLDRLAAGAADHADGVLWRRALAGAAAQRLGIGLAQAIMHPAVLHAHQLVGAPAYHARPPAGGPAPVEAVRVPAVHLHGIDALADGERDLELRFSPAGLDVLKRSSGAAIGRLSWQEIRAVELPRSRRGLGARRRGRELHVATDRGQASFELSELTDEQLRVHLEPMLARARGRGLTAAD